MFSGTTQPFNVRTEPPGAQVIVNGSYLGVTPLNIQIARDKNLNVLLRAPGYPDKALLLHRDLNPVAVLNLLSIVCWAIDLATGAMFEIEPNVLAGLTVTAALHDERAAAIALGSLGAALYLGNFYAGYEAARRENEHRDAETAARIRAIPLDLELFKLAR